MEPLDLHSGHLGDYSDSTHSLIVHTACIVCVYKKSSSFMYGMCRVAQPNLQPWNVEPEGVYLAYVSSLLRAPH